MLVFGGKFVCPNRSTGSNRKKKSCSSWIAARILVDYFFIIYIFLCLFACFLFGSILRPTMKRFLEGFWQLTDMPLSALQAQTILWQSLRISLHTMMTTMLMTTMIFMIMTLSMLMTTTIICLPWRFPARQHMLRKLAETSWSSLCFRKHETGVQFHGYVSLAGEGVKDWDKQFWREAGCIGDYRRSIPPGHVQGGGALGDPEDGGSCCIATWIEPQSNHNLKRVIFFSHFLSHCAKGLVWRVKAKQEEASTLLMFWFG